MPKVISVNKLFILVYMVTKNLKHGHKLIFTSLRSTLVLFFYLLVRALRSDIVIVYN